MSRFQYITLTNGEIVKAVYEAEESEAPETITISYDFKELTNGNISQKIAFVNENGNKIKLT